MPYINIILKTGALIPVDEADEVEWIMEPKYKGAGGQNDVLRVVCKRGDRILAKFSAEDVSGYTWHDGRIGR